MGKRGWPSMRTVAAVASAVVLLLAAGLVVRGRGASSGYSPLEVALRARPGADWSQWTRNGGNRGGPGRSGREARAVYAGAKLVDLAVALQSRDTARAADLARTTQIMLDARTDADAALSRIAARPNAPPDTLNALIGEATEQYAELGRKALELGAWAEAARLAAQAGNESFFQDGASGGMLGRAERLARGNDRAQTAVSAVRAALSRRGTAQGWKTLESRLGAMLNELAA